MSWTTNRFIKLWMVEWISFLHDPLRLEFSSLLELNLKSCLSFLLVWHIASVSTRATTMVFILCGIFVVYFTSSWLLCRWHLYLITTTFSSGSIICACIVFYLNWLHTFWYGRVSKGEDIFLDFLYSCLSILDNGYVGAFAFLISHDNKAHSSLLKFFFFWIIGLTVEFVVGHVDVKAIVGWIWLSSSSMPSSNLSFVSLSLSD